MVGVQFQAESYQRLKKWDLIPPCLTLSINRYGSRVKWSTSGKGIAPSSKPRCSSYGKGAFRLPSTMVGQLTYVNSAMTLFNLLLISSIKAVLIYCSFISLFKLLVYFFFMEESSKCIGCGLFGCSGLWHINLCRLFNAKSIFIQIISISNNLTMKTWSGRKKLRLRCLFFGYALSVSK